MTSWAQEQITKTKFYKKMEQRIGKWTAVIISIISSSICAYDTF